MAKVYPVFTMLWNGRLRTLVMAAPDPDAAAAAWAAILAGEADAATIRLGDDTSIVVVDGPHHGLVEMRFDASPELAEAAVRAGGEAAEDGVIVRDPEGWQMRFMPVDAVAPAVVEGAMLSHCTLLSPEPMAQCRWWQTAGFRLSETIGEIFGWMRPNPIHHSLAFARGDATGIQHLAVEFPDANALVAAVDVLVAAGERVEFGPGRHIVGGNLFAYVLDRAGIRWELCAELERWSPDEPVRRHGEEMRGRSVNTFGPRPPASFIEQPGGPGPLTVIV
jgi:catechol 2,3-dioxygenase-like lactoylglutathione lyase family enzyme